MLKSLQSASNVSFLFAFYDGPIPGISLHGVARVYVYPATRPHTDYWSQVITHTESYQNQVEEGEGRLM